MPSKSLVCLLAAVALVSAATCSDTDLICRWNAWKLKFERQYASAEEETYRLGVFTKYVLEHLPSFREANPHAIFAEGPFADLTLEEFRSKYLNLDFSGINQTEADAPELPMPSDAEIAKNIRRSARSWEWRSPDTSAVQNQAGCGSCWAFATVGVAEAAWHKANGAWENFAEQQLVDCSSENYGCGGGFPDRAMNYLVGNGMMRESAYPYYSGSNNQAGSCKYNSGAIVGKMSQTYIVGWPESTMDQRLQQYGPLAICLDANTLGGYAGGVLSNSGTCNQGINHAVLLVGYGHDDNAGDYWVVKNSWGAGWGEGGFFRIVRGQNACKMAEWNAVGGLAPNVAPPPTPGNVAGTFKMDNVDISPNANDIASAQKSAQDCYNWCQGTANCRAFVIVGGTCYLKSVNGPQVGVGGKYSYILKRAWTVHTNANLAPGSCDIAHAAKSFADCSSWCHTTNGCVGFVLGGDTCWLKSCTGPIVGDVFSISYVIVNRPPNFPGGKAGTAGCTNCNVAPGTCDIGDKGGSGEVDCNYYCQSMPGCRAYVVNGDHCWLKSCSAPVVAASSGSSYIMLSPVSVAGNHDLSPNNCDLANYQTDANGCSSLCHQNNACKGFVIAGSTCYLKSCLGLTSANGVTAYAASFAFSAN